MKKLSTMLLVVLMSVLCVLGVSAQDIIFMDFTDADFVAQWVPSGSTGVEVTPIGTRIYGSDNNVNISYTPATEIILDNYQYVVIEYCGATYEGVTQFYHFLPNDTVPRLEWAPTKMGTTDEVYQFVADMTNPQECSNWHGPVKTFRLDPCRGGLPHEMYVKYIALFADKALYEELGTKTAADFGVYVGDNAAKAVEVAPIGGNFALTLKAPAKNVFNNDCTVTWNTYAEDPAEAMPVADGMSLSINTAEAASAYYYATVSYSGGNYTSEPVKVVVCDEATYNDYNANYADAYAMYCDDAVAGASVEIYVGKSAELSVKGPAEYIFDGYKTEWFCNGESVATSKNIVVTAEEASSDYDLYYAVVTDADGNEIYTTESIRVFACDEIIPPIVYNADWIKDHASSAGVEYIAGGAQDGVGAALRLTPQNGDPNISISGFEVDLSIYKVMAVKLKSNVDQSLAAFHYFQRSSGKHQTGASGDYYQTAAFKAGNYTFASVTLNVNDPDATVYTGMRFDFFNNGGINLANDKMDLEYIAFFTDAAQFEQFMADNETIVLPEPEGKFWQFADDASFSGSLFANADYVDGVGVKLASGTPYTANIKTKEKFDLGYYSVIKLCYNATSDVTLTIKNDGNVIFNETLAAAENSATFDFRNIWNGEFGAVEFKATNADLTIGAIGFFTNENAAGLYSGAADIPTADGALEYESAKWWSFADTNIFYRLQAVNADRTFNENDKNGMPNTITLTAKEDGAMSFSYSKIHMDYEQRILNAEQYPYMLIGYNSAALAGKTAYIKFKTENNPDPVTVNFTWPADADNYNGRLLNLPNPDNNGYTQLFVDFASLTNIKAIDPSADAEWRGTIEYVEFFVDGLTAADAVEIAYINFFEFDTHATQFDGAVLTPPTHALVASWKTKSVVIAEYITVDDMDLEADVVTFSVEDYSRISRITLNDLKKNYPSKKVVVDGDVYDLEFYPKNVSENMQTWYYDLEVSFDGSNAGDVYRETVKELIPEGEYITGVYFLQKFVKDRSMPFKGKLIYDIGEIYNDKYLDIYKYDPRTNTVALTERAPVKEGKITITTLGGDLAIVDGGYQPTEEELKRAEAIDVYENTPWNALIFDYGEDSGAGLAFKANNAEVKNLTKDGVVYNSAISTKEGTRIELMLRPTNTFEASEYPVMVVKYKTSVNLTGSVNNYVTTDYYAGGVGYEWFPTATFYSVTGVYAVAPNWTTKIINYTDGDTMKASGFAISGEYVEGQPSKHAANYPFKGQLSEYRLDFNVGPVGTTIDIAYVAFFKTAEEAQKYVDARNIVDGFVAEEAKAEKEAADALKPQYYVFDLTDSKEATKYTFASPAGANMTKTESQQTKDGLAMKDNDNEFNITRLLAGDEQFELSEYPVLKIKVKFSIPGVTSQLYVWNTAQEGINPRCELLVEKAGEFTEQIWDFSKENMALGTWNGVLTKFRLDPMRGAGNVDREATVAYIGFFKTVEDAEAYGK